MTESNNPSAIRSQTELSQALISLMQIFPYNEITVKQILYESKLARKTFYRNFESKDDVLLSIIKKELIEYFDEVNNAKEDVLTAIFSFVEKNKELLLLLDKNNMLHVTLQCINEYLLSFRKSNVSALNPFTKLFDGLNADYLIALNTGAVWNVIALWIHQGMKDSPENVKATIAEYLSRFKTL